MQTVSGQIKLLIISVALILHSGVAHGQLDDLNDTVIYLPNFVMDGTQASLNLSLMTASTEGKVAGMRWLIKKGAEINSKTYENITPLHFAVANNRAGAVAELLKHNANVDAISNYSETPLLLAVKNQNLEIAEMLIRDSADINLAGRFGATPLHFAAAYGYHYIADLLLYYDASTWITDDEGTTPLMAAAWSGAADVADLLIQNGADPEAKDKNGYTPFLIAAQNGDTILMALLIKVKADIYSSNNSGYNALSLCIRYNHISAAKWLLKNGSDWFSGKPGTVSPTTVAEIYKREEMNKLFKSLNLSGKYRYHIEKATLTFSGRTTLKDLFTSISVSVNEPRLNAGLIVGFDFKPYYSRVLIKKDEDHYFQYMEKGYAVWAGPFKDILIRENSSGVSWSATGSVLAGYRFGNMLKGSTITPDPSFMVIPSAGFKWAKKDFTFSISAEYQKSSFYKPGPFWVRAGFSYGFRFNNYRTDIKRIRWY
jgi:ankyrin repeat protein